MKTTKINGKEYVSFEEFFKYYDKMVDRNYSTQGYKKLWNYYNEIIRSEYFQDKIKYLRKKYNIPIKGFPKKDLGTKWWSSDDYGPEVGKIFKEICKKYSLHYMDWYEMLIIYLMYNETDPLFHPNDANLFYIDDVIERKQMRGKGDLYEEGGIYEESDDMAYPIALRISPYATQRDIVDFIKKMYPKIKFYQSKYVSNDIKIGKIKTKKPKIQKRNELIYKNRNKTRKEIYKIIDKKFGDSPDEGAIGKIISIERRKRKEL